MNSLREIEIYHFESIVIPQSIFKRGVVRFRRFQSDNKK